MAFMSPVRFAASSYVLRATINAVTANLAFPSTGSLDTERDYYASGDGQTGTETDGNGRADLLAMLQATLRTHAQGGQMFVEMSAIRKVHIYEELGKTFSLLWTHANTTLDAYASAFGWPGTADTTPATTIDAPYSPAGLVLFGRPPSLDSCDRQPIVMGQARSLSGKRRVAVLVASPKERELMFRNLHQSLALSEYAGVSWSAIEYAWLNCFALGRVFRVYSDAAQLTTGAAAYKLYALREFEDPLSRNEEHPVFWDARFKLGLELDP